MQKLNWYSPEDFLLTYTLSEPAVFQEEIKLPHKQVGPKISTLS